jgi:hypothetical protein
MRRKHATASVRLQANAWAGSPTGGAEPARTCHTVLQSQQHGGSAVDPVRGGEQCGEHPGGEK